MHPLVTDDQSIGYELIKELSQWLCEITGFHSVSLQPNSGASGEYAGLVAIKAYLKAYNLIQSRKEMLFNYESAHGTNPANYSLAG